MRPINTNLDERLISQAKRLDQLTLLLQQALPPETFGHYHVANMRKQTLVIITDSPVWTTRLRQLAPAILGILSHNAIKSVQHVQVSSRVHYKPARPPIKPTIKRELSAASSRQIEDSASCIKDENLKSALQKLARHGQKTRQAD